MDSIEYYKKFLYDYVYKMKNTIEYKKENDIPLNDYEIKFIEIMKERGKF